MRSTETKNSESSVENDTVAASSSTAKPFHPALSSLSRHTGHPISGAPPEEVLDIHNIQGNILAGFNKDFQALLFLKIVDTARAKAWLRFITPSIATMEE